MEYNLKHAVKVLDYLANNGSATTRSLSRSLGLSESSLSRLMRGLIGAQLVDALDTPDGSPGRPAQIFHLERSLAYAVGVELDLNLARWVIVDALGDVLCDGELAVEVPGTNDQLLAILDQVVSAALAATNVAPNRILSLGVALHGFVDHNTGTCLYWPAAPGPQNIPVGTWLERRFHVPVSLLEEGRSLAYIESRLGSMRDVPNFIAVDLGTGIGTGIIIDHRLYLGENSMSGHLAHIGVDPSGPRCVCGARGCVEVVASTSAIIEQVSDRLKRHAIATISLSDRPLQIEEIAMAAEQGDQLCLQALNRAGELMGVGVATLSKVLNINHIVLFGTLARVSTVFTDAVKRSVRLNVLPLVDPILSTSTLSAGAVPQGAAFYALNKQIALWADLLAQRAAEPAPGGQRGS